MKELAIIAAVTVVCLCTRVKAGAAETTVVVENVEAAQISGFRELWDTVSYTHLTLPTTPYV